MNDLPETLRQELWASVHGELDDNRRDELKRLLASHPEARREFARARVLDRLLRADLPALKPEALSEEALSEGLLAAWERDQATAKASRPIPAIAPAPAYRSPIGRPAWLVVGRPAAAMVGLAAATAMVMLLVKPLTERSAETPRWHTPTLVPLAYRGAPVPPAGQRLDASSARRCQEALRMALTTQMASSGAAWPAGVTFRLTLRELPDGAFSAQLRAEGPDGRLAGEWTGSYSGLEAFLAQVPSSVRTIAEELVPSTVTPEAGP